MQRIWAILGLIFINIIGLVSLILSAWKFTKTREYVATFHDKYREFCNSLLEKVINEEVYEWLKLNSAKMQNVMGDYGVAKVYKPAGANYIINNYQMIINGISEIRNIYNQFSDLRLGREMMRDVILGIDDAILTYLGKLDMDLDNIIKEVKNPMIWFREGIRAVVTLPAFFTYWTGLIQYRTYHKLSSNIITKFISFILSFFTLVGSIITIVTGYVPFIEKIKEIIGTH